MNSLSTHLDAYSQHLYREEKSRATREKYLRDVKTFCKFAMGKEITKDLLVSWKQHLVNQKYAVRSVNSMLAGVNSFLAYLGHKECKVKNIRLQRQTYCEEEKELSKAEYFRLLEASKKNRQLNLILQTICSTGIRVSELQYFSVEGVTKGNLVIECKSKTRTILIPGKLRKQLLQYAKHRGIQKGQIFLSRKGNPLDRSNIWAAMKKLCQRAAVSPSKVFPHNLRKLFARTFYTIEKDIAKLADILGHSSIDTTRIYIITTGIEHRRKIERLGLLP